MLPLHTFAIGFLAATASTHGADVGESYVATFTKDVNSDDFIVEQVDSSSVQHTVIAKYRLNHAIYGSPSPGTTGYYPDAGAAGQVLVGGLSDDLDWHLTTMDLGTGKVINTTAVKDMVIEVSIWICMIIWCRGGGAVYSFQPNITHRLASTR